MQRGYILITKAGAPRAAQEAALRAAGVVDFGEDGPVYIDDMTNRAKSRGAEHLTARQQLIRSLREGTELVIFTPGCLGLSKGDIASVVREIGEAGAVIRVASTGAVIRWHPDALELLNFCDEAGAEVIGGRTALMRQALAKRGTKTGPQPKLIAPKIRKMWEEGDISVSAIANEAGVSAQTLYRRLGLRPAKSK